MFRRRGRIRPIRRAFSPDVPPVLQRANNLLAAGNYSAAAEAFEQIARAAHARGGPRAPMFFLQAGRARILAGQTSLGMEHLKQALAILASLGQWPRFQRAGERASQELTERGLTAEASEIRELLQTRLPPGFAASPAAGMPARRPTLPTHCPSCGAAVRPDEVEWLDDETAECAYCGSPVREAA